MDCQEQRREDEELSLIQKQRIEDNRLKALALKKSRVRQNPYQRGDEKPSTRDDDKITHHNDLLQDSRGGFMLSRQDEEDHAKFTQSHVVQDDPPALGDELITCEECGNKFAESFLLSHFKLSVCNDCRDPDEKHSLITKTEAKEIYLLKDCDLADHGGPPLQFLQKKNPRGYHGDMKLFLLSQVESRAHFVWGGDEGLEKERERRQEAKEKRKEKNYAKKLKDLRSAVYSRSALSSTSHQHVFGSEEFDPATDTWTKTCKECGHSVTFEKM